MWVWILISLMHAFGYPLCRCFFKHDFLFAAARSHKCGRLTGPDANVSLTTAARLR